MATSPQDFLSAVSDGVSQLAEADPERVDIAMEYDECFRGADEWDSFLAFLESSGGGEWVPRLELSSRITADHVEHFRWKYQPMGIPPIFQHDDERSEMHRVWDNLSQRLRWFSELMRRAATLEVHHKTELQRRILELLNGRAMTADELMAKLDRSRATVFGNKTAKNPDGLGGIRELMALSLVDNDRKIGGYFRLDSPPTGTVFPMNRPRSS